MRTAPLLLSVALTLASLRPAQSAVIYGSLGNFDCINDTGSTAHGFEIELDGVSSSSVFATFGSPYNRYGTPTITTVNGNTFVRYAAQYSGGKWSAGTDSGTYGRSPWPSGKQETIPPPVRCWLRHTTRYAKVPAARDSSMLKSF